jgi:YVTN family beta-propeller protein
MGLQELQSHRNGTQVYVANNGGNTVSVIDTSTYTVVGSPIPVGTTPVGIAITPNGAYAYVVNQNSNTVSVISTATNAVTDTVPVGTGPFGVAITPDGTKVYVVNNGDNTVSVIDTSTNTVVGSPIPVGTTPFCIAISLPAPTLTWNPNPTTITYGTALVTGQLNAQSSASGTFAYKDGSTPVNIGTILSAGTHKLTATFTSTDPNYASGETVTATINVTKAIPAIS